MSIAVLTFGVIFMYAGLMVFLAQRGSYTYSHQNTYHVADRKVPGIIGALSIAATWVWAPALFVSATQAFNNGWVGTLWFIVPNALSLLIMLPFALRIREKYPTGFTLSGFMRKRYGVGTQRTYIATLGGLAILASSVNLLAGGTVLSMLTGLSLAVTSVIMLVLILLYTVKYGVKASMPTNVTQISLIIITLLILVPATISKTGWDVFAAGINGINNVQTFFGADGRMVALTFGIISAIGLAAGPVGDQAFWQRAYALNKGEVVKAFSLSALIFTMVPVLMSSFGFLAAGSKFQPTDPGYVNLELLQSMFPAWVTVPFMLMIVAAMFSVVNSHLLAVSSLASDAFGSVKNQRIMLLVGAAIALTVANVPGNSVINMFLIYATLRSSTFLITLTTLNGSKWNRHGVFWGILVGLIPGFGMAIYANLVTNLWQQRLGAILYITITPMFVAYVWTKLFGATEDVDPDYETPAEVKAKQESLLV